MHTFLHVPFIIHAPLHTALLEVLINSDSYDQHKMVWIDAHGNLEGINAAWRHALTEENNQESTVHFSENNLLEDALLYTTKTDALIFTINPEVRTFTIITCGNQLHKVTAHHAYTTIQKYLTNIDNKSTFTAFPSSHKASTDMTRDQQKQNITS